MARSLEGYKILDLSRAASGPYCTQILADFGAEVIKVEQPGMGDMSRALPPHVKGESLHFFIANRNKKSITLDLSKPKGQEIFKRLVQEVNVVVENFRPGFMKRLGLDYKELRKISPGIIYLSISGFGQEGPYSTMMAFDYVGQAMSGIMSVTGEEGGEPVRAGIAIADYSVSVYGAAAVLAALMEWSKTGEGQYIDISMQECLWNIFARDVFPYYFVTGELPARRGNRGIMTGNPVPVNTYMAKDGKYVYIACVSNENWVSLARVIGGEELANDSRFARLKGRREHMKELDKMIQAWVDKFDSEEVLNTLTKGRVACSKIFEFADFLEDEHAKARKMITEYEQPGFGPVKIPGSPFAFSKLLSETTAPAPALGESNVEIYSQLIGLDKKEIENLKQEKVI
jgi:CoA:oxalate CoA-transferase